MFRSLFKAINERTISSDAPRFLRCSPVPSLWLVAALLVFRQVALTVICYGIGPAMDFDPGSGWLVSATIVVYRSNSSVSAFLTSTTETFMKILKISLVLVMAVSGVVCPSQQKRTHAITIATSTAATTATTGALSARVTATSAAGAVTTAAVGPNGGITAKFASAADLPAAVYPG